MLSLTKKQQFRINQPFSIAPLLITVILFCFLNSTAQNTVYTPLYTESNFTKTVDFSKPVGEIAGNAMATGSGGVSYSIPIYTPPGTNGLQASISLAYNSQASSGIAGYGWGISGLSTITRTGKNIYHNAVVAPVTYTAADAFLLDGMRLNAISGNNGANGTIYAGEAESFAKIISHTSGLPDNPDWFEVITKDGSVMEFGNSADSKLLAENPNNIMMWRINKMIDINGNYIEFKYDNANRDSRIQQILYTGNLTAGLIPYNKINFAYSTRADQNTMYEAGASTSTQYLLDKITVVHTNDANTDETVKTYRINYGFDNVNSMLKEVEEFGGDENSASLNSTIFLYGDQPQNMITSSTSVLQGSFDFYSGDFDADGRTDLLAAAKYYDPNFHTFLNTSYSLYSDMSQSSTTLLYMKSLPQGSTVQVEGANFFNFLTSDYDGDGRDDVMNTKTSIVNSVRRYDGVDINYTKSFNPNTGYTDYITVNYPSPPPSNNKNEIHSSGNFFIPGDFDGNGNQDYIVMTSDYNSTYATNIYTAYLTSPSISVTNTIIANFGVGANNFPLNYTETIASADKIITLDFDGDGKTEILVTKNQTTYIISLQKLSNGLFTTNLLFTTNYITKDSKCFQGDFNGDKKIDLLVRSINGAWNILYSTGVAFNIVPFAYNEPVVLNGNYSDDKIVVGDFNGDGKCDIAHGFPIWVNGTSTSSKFSLYYSKGLATAPFYFEQYIYNNVLAFVDLITGDFNGDGRTDLINRISVSSDADFIAFKPFGQDRLLKKTTTGHNITTSFEYKLLTDPAYPYFYERTVSLDDPANTNPINYVQFPVYALASMSMPDGIGGNNITDYTYQNAVVHRSAKGFLGFKKLTAKNSASGINTVTENEINAQFGVAYPTKQSTFLTSTNQLLSQSVITSSFQNLSTGSNDTRYFQKTDQTLSVDYLNDKASQSVNTYDNYGNIISSTTNVGYYTGNNNVVPTETTLSSSTFSIHNTPVPAKPDNVTITNTRSGMPSITATTAFTYTSNGLTATQTEFSGLPKAVTTTNTYNGFGNPVTTQASATGLNTRYTNSTYDTKGRFVLTMQKTGTGLSQTETYTVSSKWGKVLTKTSTDCLTTTNEYDAFGRLIHSILPDGNEITVNDFWHTVDVLTIPNANKLYYTKTHYLGGKPDTKNYFDKFGHNWLQQTLSMYGVDGAWHTMRSTYDGRGNLKTKTNLYFPLVPVPIAGSNGNTSAFTQPVETPRITTYNYDTYNRISSIVNDIGTVSYAYNLAGNGKMQTTINNIAGQSSSQITDAAGKVVSSTDNGGQLDFNFDSRGNQVEVKQGSTTLVSSVYDQYGRQTSLTDINAGATIYSYDAYGQLKQQTDALSNTYNMNHDDFGRVTNRTGPEGTTSYEYYQHFSGCSNDKLTKITGFNGVIKEYTYDGLRRLATETQTVDGTAYTTSYFYNSFSQILQTTYPSGLNIFQTFDGSGYLTKVYHTGNAPKNSIFQNGWVDGEGKYLTYGLGFNKTTNNTYNKDFPATTITSGIQDMSYNFDLQTGNLLQRTDNIKNQTEYFGYDNLNRLTAASPNNTQQLGITYDATGVASMGNIVAKTDAGYYKYSNNKIHAVAYTMNQPVPGQSPVSPAPVSATPNTEQLITYTPFLKTASISENGYLLNFTYGPDYERVKTELLQYGGMVETRYFMGNYEKQLVNGVIVNTREIHYINGGNGLCAILVKDDGVLSQSYIVYTDHLGSITTVANQSSTSIIAEQSFDAWGRRRDPSNWNSIYPANSNYSLPTWLYRGYTGHETLPYFSLINMNGRLYDPILGRMLSPDNFVQAPFNSQNYNRYSYCLNNPLRYTDPSGNLIVIDSWIRGFVRGLFNGGFKGAWDGANKYARNDAKIWGGLFTGSFKQIISRFTWESPQTLLGFGVSQAYVHGGRVDDISYFAGATVIQHKNRFGGFTLGSYINGDNTIRPDPNNSLFQHEYGHYLQSQKTGHGYLSKFAIPSLLSSVFRPNEHNFSPAEQDANVRAIEFFHDRIGGSFSWNFRSNPIGPDGIGNNWTMADYNTVNFQQLLYLRRQQVSLADYGIFGKVVPGIINFLKNNKLY